MPPRHRRSLKAWNWVSSRNSPTRSRSFPTTSVFFRPARIYRTKRIWERKRTAGRPNNSSMPWNSPRIVRTCGCRSPTVPMITTSNGRRPKRRARLTRRFRSRWKCSRIWLSAPIFACSPKISRASPALQLGEKHAGAATLTLATVLAGGDSSGNGGRRGRNGNQEGEGNRRAERAYRYAKQFVDHHPYSAEGWKSLISLEVSATARRTLLKKALAACGGDTTLREEWVNDLTALGKRDRSCRICARRCAGRSVEPRGR